MSNCPVKFAYLWATFATARPSKSACHCLFPRPPSLVPHPFPSVGATAQELMNGRCPSMWCCCRKNCRKRILTKLRRLSLPIQGKSRELPSASVCRKKFRATTSSFVCPTGQLCPLTPKRQRATAKLFTSSSRRQNRCGRLTSALKATSRFWFMGSVTVKLGLVAGQFVGCPAKGEKRFCEFKSQKLKRLLIGCCFTVRLFGETK